MSWSVSGCPGMIFKVTRRAFSALRVIRLKGQLASREGPKFSVNFDKKNCSSSKSVNSFDTGLIFDIP